MHPLRIASQPRAAVGVLLARRSRDVAEAPREEASGDGVVAKDGKRVIECGVWAPDVYRNLREQRGENGFPQKPTGSLFGSYRHLRKSLETSGSLRENVI